MSETGYIRTYYVPEQTKLDEEYFMLNGKKEGEYKRYYKNGQLQLIGTYINGNEEGEEKWFYKNGQLWIICNYINHILEGEYKEYHESGELEKIYIYGNGKILNTNVV